MYTTTICQPAGEKRRDQIFLKLGLRTKALEIFFDFDFSSTFWFSAGFSVRCYLWNLTCDILLYGWPSSGCLLWEVLRLGKY